jgi:hypothetical protein
MSIENTKQLVYISFLILSTPIQPFLGLGRLFSFLILYRVGSSSWTGNQPVTQDGANTIKAHKHLCSEWNPRSQRSRERSQSFFRKFGHCDRHGICIVFKNERHEQNWQLYILILFAYFHYCCNEHSRPRSDENQEQSGMKWWQLLYSISHKGISWDHKVCGVTTK